jgi:hypothetical protein
MVGYTNYFNRGGIFKTIGMTKDDLKAGYWYKTQPYKHDLDKYWYIKIKTDKNCQNISEYISDSGIYNPNQGNFGDYENRYFTADPAEINKFLPKDKQIKIKSYKIY